MKTVVVALVVALAPGSAAAQRRGPQADPDMAELSAYRLNMATLQKVSVATQHLAQALAADPKFRTYAAAQKELRALRAKEEPTAADEKRIEALEQQIEQMSNDLDKGGDANTLSEMERKIAAVPHMADALAKAGLAPREYAKFSLVMIQAGMVAGMKKAGQMKDIPAGSGIAPENVQFMIDHEKDVAALTKQMEMLNPR